MASDEQDAIEYVKALLSYLPSQQPRGAPGLERRRADLASHRRRPRARHARSRTRANQPYDMVHVIEHVVDDGDFLEVQPLFAPNIIIGFGRVEGRTVGVVANQPLQFAGMPRHRRLREGGPLRPHLRRVQRARPHLRRRARLPARHRPGVGRHHPPRRQAHLRLRRGHRPQGHRDHPQGLRRRVRRDGLQAPRRRHQPRLAHRPDRRDGRPGRGQHPVPQASSGRRGGRARTSTRHAQRVHPRSTRTRSPTPTSRPSAATSTPSSRRPTPG